MEDLKKSKSKKFFFNILIMIKAAAIGTFFYSVNRILGKLFPDHSWTNIIVMMLFSITILLYEDGMLSELHDLKPYTVAAIVNTIPDSSSK